MIIWSNEDIFCHIMLLLACRAASSWALARKLRWRTSRTRSFHGNDGVTFINDILISPPRILFSLEHWPYAIPTFLRGGKGFWEPVSVIGGIAVPQGEKIRSMRRNDRYMWRFASQRGAFPLNFIFFMLRHGFMKNVNNIFYFILQRGEFQRCKSLKEF